MSTLETMREAQLFIHSLLCATPDEAHDYLVNNGEQVEQNLRMAIRNAEGRPSHENPTMR